MPSTAGAVLVTNDTRQRHRRHLRSGASGRAASSRWSRGSPSRTVADRFKGKPLVIDFGGFVESRVIEAAQDGRRHHRAAVLPIDRRPHARRQDRHGASSPTARPSSSSSTTPRRRTSADLQQVLAVRFPKMPVLVVNHSRYISRIADDGLTVFDIAALGGLEALPAPPYPAAGREALRASSTHTTNPNS